MTMKRRILITACLSTILISGLIAQSANNAAWTGVWQGDLDGQPGVILTLAADTGEIGGTVVLNMVSNKGGVAHVIGSDTHVLMNPHLQGNVLTFEIKRKNDEHEMQFSVAMTAAEKAKIHCLNCGADSPI